jgi:hypothetical protein
MNKLALFTAAGAALMMVGGTALAQNTAPQQPPSSTGASKSHMGNSDPAKSGDAKAKKAHKPATRNGEPPKGGKNKSGGM